ncbi:hypothetical protein [Aphanothece sacrum]|uniref:Uncharacterized protein n=1 Tax=Aphanothece sacrum FPU1 TaxID=1920663 RepID=A0A401IMD4_APHSA|nr:hypothetical protein [Aphanothece sacrum]GBF82409.1 hypothetical protein AsFPU1_3838 [Aphanothece sacrum FPU1]GBF84436.1 hypothetical protein AsFPU3_1485 [Aphanothece sacrum FPU3]
MISLADAEDLAINFVMEEWELPSQEKDWFVVLNSRTIPDRWWYIVEIAIKDLPDKWVIQVYEDGECDPCYTFSSPFSQVEISAKLEELPSNLAMVLKKERSGYL